MKKWKEKITNAKIMTVGKPLKMFLIGDVAGIPSSIRSVVRCPERRQFVKPKSSREKEPLKVVASTPFLFLRIKKIHTHKVIKSEAKRGNLN